MAKLTKAHKARTGVTQDLLVFSDAIKLVKAVSYTHLTLPTIYSV